MEIYIGLLNASNRFLGITKIMNDNTEAVIKVVKSGEIARTRYLVPELQCVCYGKTPQTNVNAGDTVTLHCTAGEWVHVT